MRRSMPVLPNVQFYHLWEERELLIAQEKYTQEFLFQDIHWKETVVKQHLLKMQNFQRDSIFKSFTQFPFCVLAMEDSH